MLRALLLGFAWRVEWVGEQEQAGDRFSLLFLFGEFGAEHAALASAIGVAAEKDLSRALRLVRIKIPTYGFLQNSDGVFQAGAVAGSVGGAEGSRLTIGQVAAEDGESVGTEDFC